MVERKDQDCIPRTESFRGDPLKRWRSEGTVFDPNLVVGNDFQVLCCSEPFPYPGQDVFRAGFDCWRYNDEPND